MNFFYKLKIYMIKHSVQDKYKIIFKVFAMSLLQMNMTHLHFIEIFYGVNFSELPFGYLESF